VVAKIVIKHPPTIKVLARGPRLIYVERARSKLSAEPHTGRFAVEMEGRELANLCRS
jgi:hypothetical protein